MAVKKSRDNGNPFHELEIRMKDYVMEIFELKNKNEEQQETISALRDEIFRLKKELDSMGNKGSVIINKQDSFISDESTQILNRDDYRTQVYDNDDHSTQVLNPKGYRDDEGTQIIRRPKGSGDTEGTQILR